MVLGASLLRFTASLHIELAVRVLHSRRLVAVVSKRHFAFVPTRFLKKTTADACAPPLPWRMVALPTGIRPPFGDLARLCGLRLLLADSTSFSVRGPPRVFDSRPNAQMMCGSG